MNDRPKAVEGLVTAITREIIIADLVDAVHIWHEWVVGRPAASLRGCELELIEAIHALDRHDKEYPDG